MVFLMYDVVSRKHLARVFSDAAVIMADHAADRENLRGRHAFVAMVSHEIRA